MALQLVRGGVVVHLADVAVFVCEGGVVVAAEGGQESRAERFSLDGFVCEGERGREGRGYGGGNRAGYVRCNGGAAFISLAVSGLGGAGSVVWVFYCLVFGRFGHVFREIWFRHV